MIFQIKTAFSTVCASMMIMATTTGNAFAVPSYGFSVRMSGYAQDNESYAFSFPAFTFTNISGAGIGITSISMDDGSATQLWDYVSLESASAGIGYTLTSGDRVRNSGWHSTIAYTFTGFDSTKTFGFSLDPDTLRSGTGNIVDARPYVFNAGTPGTATATFSNGQATTLNWSNRIQGTFDPLRVGADATDLRNIYYEISGTQITAAVPEPETYTMMLAGLGLVGVMARRRKAKQTA